MKFTYTDKAKNFIADNNIENIFIKLVMPMGACCGVNSLRVDIKTKETNKESYKIDTTAIIPTYYDPQFDMVFHDKYEELVITVFGLGKMKKFITETELNPVNMS